MGGVRRAGLWLVWAGAALVLAGFAGGLLAPVGEFCSAPFLPQDEARRADSARAVAMTLTTRYREVCEGAATQQAILWWSLVWAGLAVLLVGAVWRFGRLPAAAVARVRLAGPLLWAGGALAFAAVVGGRVVPTGPLCSGPWGDHWLARAAAVNSGSPDALKACLISGPEAATLWTVGIWAGAALVAVGILVAAVYRPFPVFRAGRREAMTIIGGGAVVVAAVLCGLLLPTGSNCVGAFLPEGATDMTSPNCSPLYPAQVGRICWTFAAVGAAFAAAGFVALLVRSRRATGVGGPARPRWVPAAGLGVAAAGLLGGMLVPVGEHCDGAFLPQFGAIAADFDRPMRELTALSSYFRECSAATAPIAGLWWAVVGVGFVVFCLGFVRWRSPGSAVPRPVPATTPAPSPTHELLALADLRDRGALTAEEFEDQKRRVLGR